MRLRRILLDSVGHPDARFDPLLLDFRGDNGEALDTVLWLRNAGGKTSLLSLVFSVLQPNRNLFLGYLQKGRAKSIERYVLPEDVSHVVLEWEGEGGLPGLARPFITGAAMAQRRGAGGEDSLDRFFYALTPIGGVIELESLPTREGKQRTPYRRYRQLLEEIASRHPATDLVIREHQGDWMEYLERNGLDPEVFRYQLQMNRDEGGAVEILKHFSDADTFIDFLVEVVSDPRDTAEVSANLAQVADKIEQRPRKEKERQFAVGAIERLRPLADAYAAWTRVRDRHTQVVLRGSRLRHRIACSAEAAEQRAMASTEEAARQKLISDQAERECSYHERLANALRLELVRFQVQALRGSLDAAREIEREAERRVRAWEAAEVVAELEEVEARVRALRAALERAEEDAAGLRLEYERATVRLRRYLEGLSEQARRVEAHAREMTEATGRRRREAENREAAARERAAEIGIELHHLEAEMADLRSMHETLVREGLTQQDESARQALERARAADAAAQARLGTIPGLRREQEMSRNAAWSLAMELGERLSDLRARHEHARRELEALEQRAIEIAEHERALELMGHERVDVFAAGTTLVERLISAIADAERQLVDLQVEVLEDRRALRAIEETGLLPAALAVEQAVARLREERLSATTGWQFLAQNVPRDSWPRLLTSAPHLLDAVVVQPGTLERAADLLTGVGLPAPTANLVVAESTEFGRPSPDGHRLWVLPPLAARYDAEAAAAEREERHIRLVQADDRANALAERRDLDRELLARLRQLLADSPPGHREDLRFTLGREVAEIGRLSGEVEEAKRRAQAAGAAAADLDAEERRLREERVQLGRVMTRLEQVTDLEEALPTWQAARDALEKERALRLDEQLKAEREKEEARELEDRWRAEAARAGGEVTTWVREASELPYFELKAEPAAGAGLEQLRADYRSLRDQYELRTSGSQLAREAEAEARRATRVRARLEPYQGVVQEARRLLARPGMESARIRAERQEAARRDQELAMQERLRAEQELRTREQERRQMETDTRNLTTIPEELRPKSQDQAQERLEETQATVVTARNRRDVADAARRRAEEEAREANHEHQLLAAEERRLADRLGDQAVESHATCHPITAAEAREAVEEVAEELRRVVETRTAEEQRIRRCADALRRFASRAEFEDLQGPHRDRLTEPDEHLLGRRAQDDLEEFERRLPFLEHQLREIERHQARVTDQLLMLVDDALQSLKWLQRQVLPQGLGQWSGQRYFQIRYEVPEAHEERRLRMQILLDELINARRPLQGTELVKRALRAINRRPHFEVSVLKPNEGLRLERASVAEIGAWSGGQKLTTAILIYCALARLRADRRNPGGTSPLGVLFLDNPIGIANLSTLIDLQRLVAQKFGVQLIYTTGLDDRPALAPFTNIIRLSNRRDRGRDRGHIVQEDLEREATVEAARVFRRRAVGE